MEHYGKISQQQIICRSNDVFQGNTGGKKTELILSLSKRYAGEFFTVSGIMTAASAAGYLLQGLRGAIFGGIIAVMLSASVCRIIACCRERKKAHPFRRKHFDCRLKAEVNYIICVVSGIVAGCLTGSWDGVIIASVIAAFFGEAILSYAKFRTRHHGGF